MSFFKPLLIAASVTLIASPVLADSTMGSATTMTSPSATTTSSGTAQTSVNVNTASAKDLMKVKGINASKARAIIAYRKKHGNFSTMDELGKVKGFNKMDKTSLETIQAQLSLQ